MEELLNSILQIQSLSSAIESISESLRFLGILSFVLILFMIVIAAAIILAPALVSIIRRIKLRKVIVIANILNLLLFLVSFIVPFIVWAVLFIAALTGKREIKTSIDAPTIIINTSASNKLSILPRGKPTAKR